MAEKNSPRILGHDHSKSTKDPSGSWEQDRAGMKCREVAARWKLNKPLFPKLEGGDWGEEISGGAGGGGLTFSFHAFPISIEYVFS